MQYCSFLDCAALMPCPTHTGDARPQTVFIFAGQSNCVGRGVPEKLPSTLLQSADGVQLFHHSAAPGGFLSTSEGKWQSIGTQQASIGNDRIEFYGPEIALASSLSGYGLQADCPWHGKRLGIIKFGVGSTSISVWKQPGDLFTQFTSHITSALAALANPEIGGFFWLQGESDSGSSSHAKHHEEQLRNFVKCVREYVNRPTLPCVVSEVVWSGSHLATVNAGIRRIGDEPNNAWSSAVGLSTTADGHLDSWSLSEVGMRMAFGLLTILKPPQPSKVARNPIDWIALSSVDEPSQPRCHRYGTLRDFSLWAGGHPHRHQKVEVLVGKNLGEAVSNRLFVVSWNILSQCWLEKSEEDYLHCSEDQKSWKNRAALVIQWLKDVGPDIVLLQEVDYNVFDADLLAPMREAGYEGLVQKAKKQSVDQPCGCATFWRTSKFNLIPDTIKHCSRALVVGLEGPGKRPLAVVNVHLESSQTKCETRARQLNSALEAAAATMPQAALVMGGDFNTGADSSLLRTLRHHLWHGYPLANAYEHHAAYATTAATLCTVAFPRIRYMIDHVLYSHESLCLHSLWQCLSPAEFTDSLEDRAKGLPDFRVPSDHIPIGAAFDFVDVAPRTVGEEKSELPEEEQTVLLTKWKELVARAPPRGKGKPSEQELLVLKEYANSVKAFKAELSPPQLAFITKIEKAKPQK